MQHELPKETLTRAAIRRDIRSLLHSGMVACAVLLVVVLPISILAVWIVCTKFDHGIPLFEGVESFFLLVLSLVVAAITVKETVKYGLLLYGKRRYYITTSKLVHIKDKVGEYGGRHSEPYILTFASNGEYVVPEKSYVWSKMYPLSYDGFYNYSHIGDEFYLVVDKRGKILCAYNTKLFALQDE